MCVCVCVCVCVYVCVCVCVCVWYCRWAAQVDALIVIQFDWPHVVIAFPVGLLAGVK